MRFRILAAGALATAAITLTGCGNETLIDQNCGGSVNSASVTGSTLHASGTFKGGQPIVELSKGGTNHVYPASDYDGSSATFDLTGLPSGTYSVSWVISCNGGGEQSLGGSKVTSITVP